jgi:hypothetical protein
MATKSHYEVLSARKYYGRHATGTVLLRNGHPEYHGSRKEAVATYKKFSGKSRRQLLKELS